MSGGGLAHPASEIPWSLKNVAAKAMLHVLRGARSMALTANARCDGVAVCVAVDRGPDTSTRRASSLPSSVALAVR